MSTQREAAERILRSEGWLSLQPPDFVDEVLEHATLHRFAAGDVVYRFGDPPGGVYGLASGVLGMDAAPLDSAPRRVHLGVPGMWTGEGPFLTRKPRRISLSAIADTTLLHLPLGRMDEMAARDPNAIRYFAQILMASVEILIRIVNDLQRPDADRRIAAVLHRAGWVGDAPIPLSQLELGAMANASRKQVNAALKKFATAGWIAASYRAITVTNASALREFALGDGVE
jgi:CRP/FNR family transcriptional regulator, cyclic AMP receptor protein